MVPSRRSICLPYGVILAGLIGSVIGCKSTGRSDPKDISMEVADILDEHKWVKSCELELQNPATEPKATADLERLAGTRDCQRAYPVVRATVLNYLGKP
jgi:hypothetical protein